MKCRAFYFCWNCLSSVICTCSFPLYRANFVGQIKKSHWTLPLKSWDFCVTSCTSSILPPHLTTQPIHPTAVARQLILDPRYLLIFGGNIPEPDKKKLLHNPTCCGELFYSQKVTGKEWTRQFMLTLSCAMPDHYCKYYTFSISTILVDIARTFLHWLVSLDCHV